ncbi:hypothetical protein GCM10027579_13760 [Calidifontibacter terrae]
MVITADDGVGLHVVSAGSGPDVVVLSGGPGCVHYLADERLFPGGFRWWFPDPRGVGSSGGGPHNMARAIADLECIRRSIGIRSWQVLGHSWGSDLAVRYALDRPEQVEGVIGLAGHGLHRDREWSAAYEAGKAAETPIAVDWVPAVHAALWDDFKSWIHEPLLWRRLADTSVPMVFVAAGADIRPSWPLAQLAALVPRAELMIVEGAVHDFWATDPERWRDVCAQAYETLGRL